MKRRASQQGYVLLLVMGMLAVASFVALRFAERMDLRRQEALGLRQYVEARTLAQGAQATALFWMSTHALAPAGHGRDGEGLLREDGTWYAMPDGALLQVQDHRGLLSVNALNRPAMTQLLRGTGMSLQQADAALDVLEDYVDVDNLKRLNGAEADDYRRLGLPPPRNDWLMSLGELGNLPHWGGEPARLQTLRELLHTDVDNQFNPNTAPMAVLRARFPQADEAQLARLEGLRRQQGLPNGRMAMAAIGLPLDQDDYIYAPGFSSRLRVWAPGLPRALEYNVRLVPAGAAPWMILDQQTVSAPLHTPDERRAIPNFPASLAQRP
ncbi:type II secretion system protein GspK [Pelomonas sp. APW6]|uniref:Type II secretion system protein GspK n=1 Tax=Roseateles subflavus TaxID=3053353 RepID=A0ABT7LJ28_9BURK|nr:type II secretion system protein GspK [Pelomonas sp. APW6]MDL5032872.1 type II secretion system protein GspK [Pelomonas sp. APW6]